MTSILKEVKGIYKLTRWNEYLGSSILVTVLGLSLASRVGDINLYRIILLLIANALSFAFAFMINDIEDAEDDALDPKKVKRNPVSAKLISKEHACFYTFIVAVISLLIFATLGFMVFFIGAMSLVLGLFYSWKKVRLKSWPVIDIVSHALCLGTLEFLAAALIDYQPSIFLFILWIGFSLFSISIFGDIRNELEDYKVDKLAGLKNTSQILSLYRFRRLFAIFNILPLISMLIYLCFTLTLFNLLSVGLLCSLIVIFYYINGYKKGRSIIHPVYSGPIQTVLALALLIQLL